MPTRKHLFKAKRKDNGGWVKGYYCPTPYTRFPCKPAIYPIDTINSNWRGVEVDPETVCECTGLTDKNGKEIFEYDILAAFFDEGFSEVKTVVWWGGDCCGWYLESDDILSPLCVLDGCTLEIVGNIYDNLELLEARK